MNESIINGLFTLAGTLFGGIISYIIFKNEKYYKKLKAKVRNLSNQIISFWNLEKLYAEELGKLNSKSTKTVLQDFRTRIEEMGLERPTMTGNEANKILIKNS